MFPAHFKFEIDKTTILYWAFVALRVILTLLPQNGYVHPDEFFQSSEVLAGDAFQLEVFRPWEFNTTFPIRSIVLPYLTVGLPYHFLRCATPFFRKHMEMELLTPYFLVVFPRIVMLALSFLCDFSLYKISLIYNQNHKPRLLILATSYVILVYGTRTFSNTMEMVLMSLLIYVVTDSMSWTDDIVHQQETLDKEYKEAQSMKEKVHLKRKWNRLPYHSVVGCLPISVLTVVGVFNRPTFFAFAFPPIFFWLQRALDSKQVGFRHFHLRMVSLIPGAVTTAVVFIVCDSLYYGYLTVKELVTLNISTSNFVITPFNFFLYNMNSTNLAQHGFHPWYLHILINIPLLFGVVGILGLLSFAENIYRVASESWIGRPRILTIFGLMTASFAVPVVLLSVFPHQEPRFIIPILVPLVFLQGNRIHCTGNYRGLLTTTWYLFNFLGVVFYGFLHQGGMYPAICHLRESLEVRSSNSLTHVVFCNTYMPPTFPLMLPKLGRLSYARGQWKYIPPNRVRIHDLAGASMEDLREDLLSIMQGAESDSKKMELEALTLLIIPTMRGKMFQEHFATGINLTLMETFWPHVTTEFPPLGRHAPRYKRRTVYDYENFWEYLRGTAMEFGLAMYQVERTHWHVT